jgi:hypothetical protein
MNYRELKRLSFVMLYCKAKSENDDYRKEELEKEREGFTSVRSWVGLEREDY